jgi:hypothetical protein
MLCYRSLISNRNLHMLRFGQLFSPAVRSVICFAGHDVGVSKIINFSLLFSRRMVIMNARLNWMPLFHTCSLVLQTSTFLPNARIEISENPSVMRP